MIQIPSGVRVWVATWHTDIRCGMSGLALTVQQAFRRDPHAGDLDVFRGRLGDLIKILWHDRIGTNLYAKRLERGRFLWPAAVDADTDTYRCPAGEQLTRRFSSVENGLTLQVFWADACAACQVKGQCATGKERRIKRWEHEHVIDAMQARLDRMPEAMGVRRRTVEHVFGTLKDWMG